MIISFHTNISRIMGVVLAIASVVGAFAQTHPVPLITDYNSIRVNQYEQNQGMSGVLAEYLIDRNPSTFYHSNYTYNDAGHVHAEHVEPLKYPFWVEARLNELTDESKTLYIYTQARAGSNNGHPTQFRIAGSHDGINWIDNLATVNVNFSGTVKSPGEENFSEPFRLPSGYRWLRFICTATKDNFNSKGGYPMFILAEFQLYRSDTNLTALNDSPQAWMEDESHTLLDYNEYYKDFTLKHTRGVVNEKNHNGVKGLSDWCDWSKWVNGTWTEAEELKKEGIEMPDFTYINIETAPWGRVKDGDRQRTHVTEHTVYAIPGQVTTLYPFSDIHTNVAYHENFVRWYDYAHDGNNPYLDFLHNPKMIARTDKMGFLGSTYMANGATEQYDMYIYTIDDYQRMVDRVAKGETRIRVKQCADLNFTGRNDILPIGWDANNPFRGVYDGGGFAIYGLVIDKPGWDQVGMFGHVGAAVIRNLHVYSDCRFSGRKHVGLIGAIDAKEYESTATGTIITGGLLIHNVSTAATVRSELENAGGILGCNIRWSSQFQVMIANCAVLGPVSGGAESGSISGWIGNKASIYSCYNVGSIQGIESKEKSYCRGNVCIFGANYDNNEGNNLSKLPYAINDANLAGVMDKDYNKDPDRAWWAVSGWGNVLPRATLSSERFSSHERGVYATFYCPSDQDFETQYIAADFSQTFKPSRHVDYANKTITEPVIAFRHIFTVVNAKDLADQVSGSEVKNAKFVSENRRTVRARAGVDFQIRFEHPQPVEQSTRTTMFYLDPQGVVRRVRRSKIKVTDRDGNDRTNIFYQAEAYQRPSARQPMYGDKLDFYDEGKLYDRMMKCDAKDANGRFTVHLVGCDENGNELKIYGSDKDLILAEYIVNFVDEQGAVMTTEQEMHTAKYAHTRPATLHELYGDPFAVVNFDEYTQLDNLSNRNDYILELDNIPQGTGRARMYKWPVPWGNSQYAFGFHERHDYNMYMLADHSVATPYKGAAQNGTQAENFNKGTGRFDRLFYDTEGEKRGFFYYANAASDPGVTASLDLSGLCPGSTLYVSAWLCEFSNASESQNIIFNFNAVKNDGSEVTIHSFVTGYVPQSQQGKWMHVFYQFTPNLSQLNLTSADIHSYKLVLENNCKSSNGADYAIDDIRVYAAKPRVYAYQTMPLCRADEGTDVRVETPFEVMLATLGSNEASTTQEGVKIDCFYTFIDKAKYDEAIKNDLSGAEAFDKAVVRYRYMNDIDSDDQTFGRVSFNTHFRSNKEYVEGDKEVGSEAFGTTIEGERYLVINTCPQDKDLVAGKEYIVALYLHEQDDSDEIVQPGASEFDIASPCSKSSVFRIHASGVVKVDGIAVPDLDNIQVCENQTPVVQVDVQAIDENGNLVDMVESAVHDWWVGDMASYIEQKDAATGKYLYSVMNTFRKEYPDADTWDVEPKGDYTESLRDYLGSLASNPEDMEPDDASQPRLQISRSSYIFPPLKLGAEQDTTEIAVVAIPIDRVTHDKYMICLHPQEVRLTVRNNSPELDHGFTAINYPARIIDVPLRVGLRQLRGVTTASVTTETAPSGELIVPVRRVKVVTDGVTALERIPDDPYVYLAGTDDPQYLDLDVVKDPSGNPMGLKPVGRMTEIHANGAGSSADNLFRLAFDESFRFKEGHTYRLRFSFRENGVSSLPTGDDGEGPVRHCHGQHVLTLKVVPEYQMWVGADGSSNWSDDANWRRVSTEELLHVDAEGDSDYNDFVTNRGELTSTENSFVPMDFTKVIVPAGVTVPMLYDSPKKAVTAGKIYMWPEILDAPAGIGEATADIQYDMASEPELNSRNIGCRPWYTNTCDHIHLHSNAEITGQHLLGHNRAWVDFEIEPSVWYTLSSPLTGVVAGDMYLPTVGARQKTELFKPIVFDTSLNDRFAPAVYQRSWNTATATVYELGGDADGRNVAVRTTWSNVYNDVKTDYGVPGEGFSIKADVSKALPDNDEPIDHVMFRLPKDDTKYIYFDHNSGQTGHETAISRVASKLHAGVNGDVSVTVSGVDNSRYFLVGNPFMAHLDMVKFLQDNASVINGKYWILNSEGQGAAILSGDEFSDAGTLSEPELLAPMQGFFVEAKNAAKSLTLSFKAANTVGVEHDPANGNFLRTPALRVAGQETRSAYSPVMRISAITDGAGMSQAVVSLDKSARSEYDETEDMALLLDSHQGNLCRVYTVAGNMAATVNTLPELVSTELGVSAPAGVRAVLHFDGVESIGEAVLYDAVENVSLPITEGMEYTVEGNVSGRLYIKGIAEEVLASDAIRLGVSGGDVTVMAPDNGLGLSVTVYDSLGRIVMSRQTDGNSIAFSLEQGVYVVDARNGGVEPFTRKIMVR